MPVKLTIAMLAVGLAAGVVSFGAQCYDAYRMVKRNDLLDELILVKMDAKTEDIAAIAALVEEA